MRHFRLLRLRIWWPLLLMCLLIPLSAQDQTALYVLPQANIAALTNTSLASLPNGRVAVSNPFADTVSLLDMVRNALILEIPVGDEPRGVAVTPDNTRVVVANRGAGTVSIITLSDNTVEATYPVGALPMSVVATNDTAYMALHGTNEIVGLTLDTGEITARIAVPAFPTGLALWGNLLYVTHFQAGTVSLIFLPTQQVVQTLSLGGGASLAAGIEIDTRARVAYVPHMRLNPAPETPFDGRARPVVAVIDLATFSLLSDRRLELDLLDRPVGIPYAAKLDANRTNLYVANAGSGDVTVINVTDKTLTGFFETGVSPRALALSRDGANVYTHNFIDQTVTVTPTRFLRPFDTLPTTQQPPDAILQMGAQLFYTARDPRLSATGTLACGTCHFDGWSDGQVWRGLNTPSLLDLPSDLPYGWLGTWTDWGALDEHIRQMQAGEGLGVDSVEASALVNYLKAFTPPETPFDSTSDGVERGAALFTEWKCNTCHTGSSGTDQQLYDVGTGGQFLTPGLNGLWNSAPYLHDGHAPLLEDVFTQGQGDHHLVYASESDISALVAYLRAR
jgi:YVTN family beta-propeller protein